MKHWFLWLVLIAIAFGIGFALIVGASVIVIAFVIGTVGLTVWGIADLKDGKTGDCIGHFIGAGVCAYILSLFF